jgi:glycerol-3-phosphate dehydrogenase (NAD(P)+)
LRLRRSPISDILDRRSVMTDESPFKIVAVIGAGAWGTALANLVARNGADAMLWAREPEVAEAVNARRENPIFLPGVRLCEALRAASSLEGTAEAEAFLAVVPAQHSRGVLARLAAAVGKSAPVMICSKGVELKTGMLLTQMLAEVWRDVIPAVLSGPSFAEDVARGFPTAVTLACADARLGRRWVATIGAPHFRPYLSDDLIGASLGGAVKNVLAIAAGAVEGLGLGASARAALIARGFAEFQRLGVALGARPETMGGLSGLGDLVLTATSAQSRNFSLGVELGKGRTLSDILGERRSVAEGVATAPAVVALAKKAGIETPISAAVAELVSGAKPIGAIVADLLARPFKAETA